VERFFGTAQDPAGERLGQGGARSRDQANRYLEQVYLPLWNRRFSCEAKQAGDAHRALDRRLELDSVLSQGSHLTPGNRPRCVSTLPDLPLCLIQPLSTSHVYLLS
jgi:hypothetical protein